MANPTFDGTALTSEGEREIPGPPQSRTYIDVLPGVRGAYAQQAPHGACMIILTGVLTATGASRSAAINALRVLIKARQAMTGEIKTYVGTGSVSTTNCILQSYIAGPLRITGSANPFTAMTRIRAQIVDLDP